MGGFNPETLKRPCEEVYGHSMRQGPQGRQSGLRTWGVEGPKCSTDGDA